MYKGWHRGGEKTMAAHNIIAGLSAEVPKSAVNNVIVVSYRNPDPELAKRVLEELVSQYFVKHLEVHRSADAFNFVTQQTDQVRSRLGQTQEELERLKGVAGISSLGDSTASLNMQMQKIRDALQSAEAEHAEQKARLTEMEKSAPSAVANSSEVKPAGPASQATQRRRDSAVSDSWLNGWKSCVKGKWICSPITSRKIVNRWHPLVQQVFRESGYAVSIPRRG